MLTIVMIYQIRGYVAKHKKKHRLSRSVHKKERSARDRGYTLGTMERTGVRIKYRSRTTRLHKYVQRTVIGQNVHHDVSAY